jgi:hypothetical protein
VRFVDDRHAGYLAVQNGGAESTMHALISVNSGISTWPSTDVFACWEGLEGSHLKISSGSTRKLVVARLEMRGGDYRWSVPYISGGQQCVAASSFFADRVYATPARLDISITIGADPPPAGQRIWLLGIIGKKIFQGGLRA